MVLVGTVVDVDRPPTWPVLNTASAAAYTLDVNRVLRGVAGPEIEVRSALSGVSCGLENIRVGQEYVVFAGHASVPDGKQSARLRAGLCGGTQPATPSFLAAVEAATGPGVPPDPSVEPAAPAWNPTGAAAAVLGVVSGLLAGLLIG